MCRCLGSRCFSSNRQPKACILVAFQLISGLPLPSPSPFLSTECLIHRRREEGASSHNPVDHSSAISAHSRTLQERVDASTSNGAES